MLVGHGVLLVRGRGTQDAGELVLLEVGDEVVELEVVDFHSQVVGNFHEGVVVRRQEVELEGTGVRVGAVEDDGVNVEQRGPDDR